MKHGIKQAVTVIALIAAFALGGAAVAGAVQDNQNSTPRGRESAQRSNETALTGDTAAKVRAAALAEVPGGTVERVETDAHGHAAYEAHMTTSDGNRVTVYVNAQFEVVSTEKGRGHGRGGPGGRRSDETAVTGDTAAKVRAAALAKAPGGTVDRVETDGDGIAAYEAHMTKADGSRITVYVNKQFDVVKVEQGRR
jgi:uncharacterized membrane protein YkoI